LLVHINKTGGSSIEKALRMPFQHRTARELIDLVGPKQWDRCFTFAFVRNPWAKVASHFNYRVATNQTGLGEKPIPFPTWVKRAYGDRDPDYYDNPKMFMPQTAWICDVEGRELVDFVGRFENLERDFLEVCRRINRENVTLPHLKRSSGRTHYSHLYDEEARQVVEKRFAEDIRRFSYGYEAP
jgi:hypothetical protein